MKHAFAENAENGRTSFVTQIKSLPTIFSLEENRVVPLDFLCVGCEVSVGFSLGHYSITPDNEGFYGRLISVFLRTMVSATDDIFDPLANPVSGLFKKS